MKKIPESFELDEDDIKEAITAWLNEEHGDGEYNYDYNITLKVEDGNDPRSGINSFVIKNVFTAKAVKED